MDRESYILKRGMHSQRVTIISLLIINLGLILVFGTSQLGLSIDFTESSSSLGASLVTAGILTITLDRLAVRAMSDRIEDQLAERLADVSLVEAGLARAIDETPFDELCRYAKDSDELVIVQTWAPSLQKIIKSVEGSLTSSSKLTVYLLHPDSPIAEIRSLDLQERSDHVAERVRDNITILRSLYRRLKLNTDLTDDQIAERLEVRLYTSMPACAIYKLDSVMYIASYWIRGMSAHRLNYVLQGTGAGLATKAYLDHIKELQAASLPVKFQTDDIPSLKDVEKLRA